MVRNQNVPIDEEQRIRIREAMENSVSLAEITRKESVCRVVSYLLEDESALKQYLENMAGAFTVRRQQITYNLLIASIFHDKRCSSLSKYHDRFLDLLTCAVEMERARQKTVFIAENHLQIDIHSDVWKVYERYGDVNRLKTINFLSIRSPSLRYEMRYYLRYMYERAGKVNVPLYCCQYMALNALTEVNPRIRYFADITEADARALLLLLENTRSKRYGTGLSQYYIAKATSSVRRIIDYLMGNMRDIEIKSPRPHVNPFANITFHNTLEYTAPTSAIPESIIEQINLHSEELSPIHKLLYDIFINTGLRLKEVFFLKTDCVETSRYDGICQLKFTPHKVLASRRRHGVGDYHRVMIPQALADEISGYISNTLPMRKNSESSYIFLSQRLGYYEAVMDSLPFIKGVRSIIEKYDIRDEDGELWHFTSRQFRKTVAVMLIENGATTAELAYWLGHLSTATATRYYAEVRKMKLVELNTKFFKEKFDLILSGEQLETYTEEERRLLYVDFRLEQRRVEFGYCLSKAADGPCQSRGRLYNCVNCTNLCTGKKYLPYWDELLAQQKTIVNNLMDHYGADGDNDYSNYAQYQQELRMLKCYESIVFAINNGGDLDG